MLNPLALLLRNEDWDPQRMEVYAARALGKICEGGLELARRHGAMLVNYRELPLAMFGRVARHFELGLEQVPGMLEKSQRNAKSPGEPFSADSAAKQLSASEAMRTVAETYLRPVYLRLEAERALQLEAESTPEGELPDPRSQAR